MHTVIGVVVLASDDGDGTLRLKLGKLLAKTVPHHSETYNEDVSRLRGGCLVHEYSPLVGDLRGALDLV
ncbi:hypothetical protein GCM10028828_09110 [Corynebacterium tapiri]